MIGALKGDSWARREVVAVGDGREHVRRSLDQRRRTVRASARESSGTSRSSSGRRAQRTRLARQASAATRNSAARSSTAARASCSSTRSSRRARSRAPAPATNRSGEIPARRSSWIVRASALGKAWHRRDRRERTPARRPRSHRTRREPPSLPRRRSSGHARGVANAHGRTAGGELREAEAGQAERRAGATGERARANHRRRRARRQRSRSQWRQGRPERNSRAASSRAAADVDVTMRNIEASGRHAGTRGCGSARCRYDVDSTRTW